MAATYFAREAQKRNFCLLILALSADIIHTCLPIMKLNWCTAGKAQKWLIVLQLASKSNCKSVRVEKSDSSNILVFTMITNCDDMIMIDLTRIIIKSGIPFVRIRRKLVNYFRAPQFSDVLFSGAYLLCIYWLIASIIWLIWKSPRYSGKRERMLQRRLLVENETKAKRCQ